MITAVIADIGLHIFINSPAGDIQGTVTAYAPGGNIVAVDGDASAFRTGYIGKKQRDSRGAQLCLGGRKQASLALCIVSADQRDVIDVEAVQRCQTDADLAVAVQKVNQAVFITDLLIVPAYIAHAADRNRFSIEEHLIRIQGDLIPFAIDI